MIIPALDVEPFAHLGYRATSCANYRSGAEHCWLGGNCLGNENQYVFLVCHKIAARSQPASYYDRSLQSNPPSWLCIRIAGLSRTNNDVWLVARFHSNNAFGDRLYLSLLAGRKNSSRGTAGIQSVHVPRQITLGTRVVLVSCFGVYTTKFIELSF